MDKATHLKFGVLIVLKSTSACTTDYQRVCLGSRDFFKFWK